MSLGRKKNPVLPAAIPKNNSIPKIFIKTSKILVQFFIFIQSFTEQNFAGLITK